MPKIYQLQPIGNILEEILIQLLPMANSSDAFILVDDIPSIEQSGDQNSQKSIFKGIGKYNVQIDEFTELLDHKLMEDIGRARTEMKALQHPDGVIIPLGNESNSAIGVI